MIIVLLGIQGSGKSTQGNLLSKELKLPYLSTGHIFREIAKEKTAHGRHFKELLSTGALIPDELTLKIVQTYLKRPEYRSGFIIDGFPRTLLQAKRWKAKITKVVFLELDQKEALWRLVMRDQVRDDNTVQAVQTRIEHFFEHTKPVVEYFEKKNLLARVDAMLKPDKVNDEILKSLGTHLVHNHLEKWEKKKKSIIAVVGLSGSGKTEASQYLAKTYKLPVVSFSSIVNDYVDAHGLQHTEAVHRKLRNEFRQKHGMKSMAFLSHDKIKAALEKNKIIVIEGMYSWEEYEYVCKAFDDVNVTIVATWTQKSLRYARVAKRSYRAGLSSRDRDIHELLETNKGPTIAFADFLVKNDFSIKEFYDKLDSVYQKVLYS